MTDWTPTSNDLASWSEEVINVLADVIYDNIFEYDADFLVYDGDYITGETNWLGVGAIPTAWEGVATT
ncbi:MAG: hypothetical protein KAJ75_06155 [Alphaproteobacteria bacterium]|nr:hypothetical protein [Alphaproteobacteria bacterium]